MSHFSRGRQQSGNRMYGFFRCTNCNGHWESSHVYRIKGTGEYYKQECKNCVPKVAVGPYKTEPIKCSMCGLTTCICTDEDLEEKRHTDPNKPHRSDLCQKCKSGRPCKGASF